MNRRGLFQIFAAGVVSLFGLGGLGRMLRPIEKPVVPRRHPCGGSLEGVEVHVIMVNPDWPAERQMKAVTEYRRWLLRQRGFSDTADLVVRAASCREGAA